MGTGDEGFTVGVGKAVSETLRALKFIYEGSGSTLWIPKSVIHDDSEVFEVGGEGTLIVKRWYAEKEGLDESEILDGESIQIFFIARLNLTEQQCRALAGIFSYSVDDVHKMITKSLGQAALEGVSKEDVIELCHAVQFQLGPSIKKMEIIRQILQAKDVEAMMREMLEPKKTTGETG